MKCPRCKKNMIGGMSASKQLFYCLRCDKAIERPESELNGPTPTETPGSTQNRPTANVDRLNAISEAIHRSEWNRRGNKFGNRITERHGIMFHSKKEADYYDELCMMEAAGEISGLSRQVRYKIEIAGVKICTYVADFVYTVGSGATVVVDVKGYATPVYRMKKRLMLACLNLPITEV